MKRFGFKTFFISAMFVAFGAVGAQAGPPLCNGAANGILDGDEQCETGPCCTAKCELVSAATVCRAAANATCDIAETCGTQSPAVEAACPADVVVTDGTTCSDGLFCTINDSCSAGTCGGDVNTCDDGEACTADSCSENKNKCEYSNAANGTSCDDGSACTTDETCTGGVCGGGNAVVCTDDNACTDD
ncbi:MAG: hypothetical protein ABR587_06685, partial [Candidatus Binatia bacterium]